MTVYIRVSQTGANRPPGGDFSLLGGRKFEKGRKGGRKLVKGQKGGRKLIKGRKGGDLKNFGQSQFFFFLAYYFTTFSLLLNI